MAKVVALEERLEELQAGEEPRVLTVSEILDAPDLPESSLFIPEWGGMVKVRGLSKAEQFELRKFAIGPDGEVDPERTELGAFIFGVIAPKFTLEHAALLRKKSAGVMDRILLEIRKLSGADEGALQRAKAGFREGSSSPNGVHPGA